MYACLPGTSPLVEAAREAGRQWRACPLLHSHSPTAPLSFADKQKADDKLHAAICATPAVAFEPQGGLDPGDCAGPEEPVQSRPWNVHAKCRAGQRAGWQYLGGSAVQYREPASCSVLSQPWCSPVAAASAPWVGGAACLPAHVHTLTPSPARSCRRHPGWQAGHLPPRILRQAVQPGSGGAAGGGGWQAGDQQARESRGLEWW